MDQLSLFQDMLWTDNINLTVLYLVNNYLMQEMNNNFKV